MNFFENSEIYSQLDVCQMEKILLLEIGGKFSPVVVDTIGNVAACVIDIGGNFASGVIDTGGKFATGVNDTGGAPWLANISANIRKNL